MARTSSAPGWAFPLRIGHDRRHRPGQPRREIEESIRLILNTAPGERPMRPEFGCGIHDYVFAPADATTAGQIAFEVRAVAGAMGAPHRGRRRRRRRLDADDPGHALHRHQYVIRGTNDPRNLVFPFYVIPAEQSTAARSKERLMALPAPNLDDRRFQDLVDDAKRLVQRRCPEWTDHNVSDPGVTLIELFA